MQEGIRFRSYSIWVKVKSDKRHPVVTNRFEGYFTLMLVGELPTDDDTITSVQSGSPDMYANHVFATIDIACKHTPWHSL